MQDDALPIHELYGQIKNRITVPNGMEDLDRSSQEFEPVFKKLCASKSEQVKENGTTKKLTGTEFDYK